MGGSILCSVDMPPEHLSTDCEVTVSVWKAASAASHTAAVEEGATADGVGRAFNKLASLGRCEGSSPRKISGRLCLGPIDSTLLKPRQSLLTKDGMASAGQAE